MRIPQRDVGVAESVVWCRNPCRNPPVTGRTPDAAQRGRRGFATERVPISVISTSYRLLRNVRDL